MPPPLLCLTAGCGHDVDWHGQRAGSTPGECMRPDCTCPAWNPPTIPPRAPRLSDPRHDRDLYLAWVRALDVATHGGDPDAGYAVVMDEIERWHRRLLGMPLRQAQPPMGA